MKKGFAVILVLAMVAGLVACGTKKTQVEPTATDEPKEVLTLHTGEELNVAEGIKTEVTIDYSNIAWPEKSIEVVLGWAAGGGADLTSRAILQPFVEDILGQKFVISYMAGSGGRIAWEELAKNGNREGYQLGWIANPGYVMGFALGQMSFEMNDGLTPVCCMGIDPGIIVVPNDSEFGSVEDLVAYAKANPGSLNVAGGQPNGDDDLFWRAFCGAAGITSNDIPYADGAADRISSILGGHTQIAILNASEFAAYSTNCKVIVVASEDPVSFLPDVPTCKSLGYDVIAGSERGLCAPAGVPEEVIAKLSDAVEEAMKDPECQQKLADLTLTPYFLNYKEYKLRIDAQYEMYKAFVGN